MAEGLDGALARFREDYPDPGSVGFLMMRFSEHRAYQEIEKAVKRSFLELGIFLVRADDKEYAPELLTNIKCYMHGCGLGVAIFDRIQKQEFNPNVSLELGFMMALPKPVFILKDQTLDTLQTDMVGRLYASFDSHDPGARLREDVAKWMRSYSINPRTCDLSLHMEIEDRSWFSDSKKLDAFVEGISLFVPNAGYPKFEALTKEEDVWAVQLRTSARFADGIAQVFESGQLSNLTGINIRDVVRRDRANPPRVNYVYGGVSSGEAPVNICRLERFEQHVTEAEEAASVLPRFTNKVDECAVYVTRTADGFYYLHSNFVVPTFAYPTKIMTARIDGLGSILPCIVGREDIDLYSDDKLTLQHINHVRYMVNRKLHVDGKLAFDSNGARHIELVDIARIERG